MAKNRQELSIEEFLGLPRVGSAQNPGIAQSVPRNTISGFFADKLGSARNALNENVGLPFIETGIGLGDLFMGEAPEMLDDISWGAPMTQPTGHGRKLDPRMGDVLTLPLPWAGAGKGMQLGGRALLQRNKVPTLSSDEFAALGRTDPAAAKEYGTKRVEQMMDDITPRAFDPQRRAVLRMMGLGGAATAAPLTAMKVLKETGGALGDDVIRSAVPMVEKAASRVSPSVSGIATWLRTSPLMLKAFEEGGMTKVNQTIKNLADYDDPKYFVDEDSYQYLPSSGFAEHYMDDVAIKEVLDSGKSAPYLQSIFDGKAQHGAMPRGNLQPPGTAFNEYVKDYGVDRAFASSPDDAVDGYLNDVVNDVVNSGAKNLEEIRQAHLQAVGGNEKATKIINDIFDDPNIEERLMKQHLRAEVYHADEIGFDWME